MVFDFILLYYTAIPALKRKAGIYKYQSMVKHTTATAAPPKTDR